MPHDTQYLSARSLGSFGDIAIDFKNLFATSDASTSTADMLAADIVVGASIEEKAKLSVPHRTVLFSGKPQGSGEVILFDSARDQDLHPLHKAGTINRLIISFAGEAPAADGLGAELCLLVYVGDLATPRARVKLADLVRQGGARPLNLSRNPDEVLQLVLVDPSGAWSQDAPHIEVVLEWA